jgi:dTMP kinase
MTSRGILVSIDGPGGAGKSTIINHLVTQLHDAGLPVTLTAEPTTGPIGALARTLVADNTGHVMACLFAADRYQHVTTMIQPRLAAGQIVLCDRYLPSGLVVQRADGVDLGYLTDLNANVPLPDLAVILTGDPQIIAARVQQRGAHNRYQGDAVKAATENEHYRDAIDYLRSREATVLVVDTTNDDPADIATTIAARIQAAYAAATVKAT